MKKHKELNDVIVKLTGVEVKAETSRLAGHTKIQRGIKKKGKYEIEIIKGEVFNVSGDLMNKERVIDRTNDHYKEKVTNANTGEIVRDIEESLSSHTGRGSDRRKKNP